MPDISTLLEKDSKKKFKKSSYRPWNYLDEIEKEAEEKKGESCNSAVINTQVNLQPEETTELSINENINETSKPINTTIEHEKSPTMLQVNKLSATNEIKKEPVNSPLYSILRLSGHQKVIFSFILERCLSRGLLSSGVITSQSLMTITKTTLSMVNTSIQRLVDKGLISRENGKRGRGGFYCFAISESVKDGATEYKRLSAFDDLDGTNKKSDENQFDGYDLSNTTDYRSNEAGLPKELETIDISSLQHIGFTKKHLSQLLKQGKLDLITIQDSINHFAYDLQYNKKEADIKTSPVAYFMGILLRVGLYNPPDNYESPKDRALRELLERKKTDKEKREAMIKELINIAFEDWQAKLNQDEKDKLIPEEIRKSRLSGAKLASLRTYFSEHVWPKIAPKEIDY